MAAPASSRMEPGVAGPITGMLNPCPPPPPSSPMPPTPRQRQGRWAEQRALRLLQGQGWQVISRNWHCRWGELDLVCEKPGRLLLVEVKGRRPGSRDGAGTSALQGLQRTRLRRVVCAKTLPTIRGSRLRTSDRRDSSSRVVCQLLCQAWPLSNRLALRQSASSVHGIISRRLANRNCLMQHPSIGISTSAFLRRLSILAGDG